jgi:hypothetical protein
MREIKIFYSWQSDLPNNTNRSFIQTALEGAVKNLQKDESIEVVPRIDKDTQDVLGTPSIPETILQKIEDSDFFLCDVTIINSGSKFRPTPNPNVLFELGYAVHKFGWERILMICNQSKGDLSQLPFDLDKRRVLLYSALPEDENKSNERKRLQGVVESHLRAFIEKLASENSGVVDAPVEETPLNQKAIELIKGGDVQAINVLREYFETFTNDLEKFDIVDADNVTTTVVIEHIEATKDIRDELVDVIENICRHSSEREYYAAIHDFFESLIPYMEPSRRGSPYNQWQADHYKFFINEIFLYATASILKHRRFELLNELTVPGYYVAEDRYRIKTGLHDFIIFNTHSDALRYYNDRLPQKWNSIYAKFKNDRATRSDIKFTDLMQADFFLYIFAQLKENTESIFPSYWYPDTLPYAERMYQPFEIFSRAESKSFFDSLRVALGGATKEDLEKLAQKLEANRQSPKWGLFSPKLEFFTGLEKIATKA